VALYKEKIMKIAILDDYQDVVRHCACFAMLKDHDVKVFNSSAVGVGQLAIRLAPFDALVLIRERTRFNRALLQRLPNLKLISQTGKVAGHIDLAAAREKGIAIAEGVGDATAPAELTWALIMAASRRLTNYSSLLQQGTWQASSVQPERNRLGRVLNNAASASGVTAKSANASPVTLPRLVCTSRSGAVKPAAHKRCRMAIRPPLRARHFLQKAILSPCTCA
jgi:hypothetical protein